MEQTIIRADGMLCGHCVRAITGSVGALPGVSGVSVNLNGKTVTVDYEPSRLSLEQIKSEIRDQGYEVID